MKRVATVGLFPSLLFIAFVIIGISILPRITFAITPAHPLIIVPTVLGTLPSEDGPVLDPVFHSYDNLIDTFVANGYVEGSTLFVLPYDWEQSMVSSASELADLVAEAKSTCPGCTPATTVDIVGHGMGGLVAWQFLQSAEYLGDVNKLVWLGSPSDGVSAAYNGYGGGIFELHAAAAGDGLGQALIDAQARSAGEPSTYSYIQNHAPAFGELLPIVLINYLTGVPFPGGYPPNPFIANLWNNDVSTEVVAVTSMLGDNGLSDTPQSYDIIPSTNPPLWPYGEPTATTSDTGDGLVSRFSIENYLPPSFEYTASHHELPTAAQSDIFAFLNGSTPSPVVTTNYSVSCVFFVSTTPGTNIQIVDPLGNRLGKDFSSSGVFTEIPNSFYSGYNAQTEYGLVVNPEDGLYTIGVEGVSGGSFTVDAKNSCADGTSRVEVSDTLDPGETTDVDVTIVDDEVVVPPPAGDTTPPSIVINEPVGGATYLTTDVVHIVATITDDSAIAETHYFFNGTEVDPNLPLDLANAPLGSASVEVSATDEQGNEGSTNAFFTIVEDTIPPSVVINNPTEGATYSNNQNDVFVSTTITDEQSPIVSTTYLFDSTPIDPVNPLPITTASLGSHTVSVSATDANGNVGSASVGFFIIPWDSGAPTITINSPVQDAVYHPSQSVPIDADIIDPEGSAITSIIYLLNGNAVDPLSPLPLSTSPLGTSLLEITATDEFGNTGTATVTFSIDEPSEETTTLTAVADTFVRNGAKNTNEGASPILRIQGAGDNRVLVRFDEAEIEGLVAGGTLLSATLEFDIEDSKNNWGPLGREVAIHRLAANWTEGNGKNAELTGPDSTRGTGPGATWDCATDADIANHRPDCSVEDDWNMRLKKRGDFLAPWVEEQTDGVVIQRGQTGSIQYDVTSDVNLFLSGEENYGWIVLKSLSFRPGYITFHSKDAGGATAPRLILNYIPGN